mmetsp:Transcript_11779/g.50466  ORF Transcript_11779/g.50466 Transcript_11779/m.50466 type:complete len:258 (+) Transcript_11779:2268-3041(+)
MLMGVVGVFGTSSGGHWPRLTASMNGVFRGSSYARKGPSFTVNPSLQNVITWVSGASGEGSVGGVGAGGAARDAPSASPVASAVDPSVRPEPVNAREELGAPLEPREGPSRSSCVPSTAPEARAPSSTLRIRSALLFFLGSCTTEPDAAPPVYHSVGLSSSSPLTSAPPRSPKPRTLPLAAARVERGGRAAGEATDAATGAAPGASGAPDPGAGSSDPGAPSPSPCSKNASTAAATSPAADSRKKRALSTSAHDGRR